MDHKWVDFAWWWSSFFCVITLISVRGRMGGDEEEEVGQEGGATHSWGGVAGNNYNSGNFIFSLKIASCLHQNCLPINYSLRLYPVFNRVIAQQERLLANTEYCRTMN